MKTVQVPAAHFNSTITDQQADDIVVGQLIGESQTQIAAHSGALPGSTAIRMRGIQVPDDFPDSHDGVMADVLTFLDVALWKGTRRLAQEVMEIMKPESLPVSVAVLVDKVSMLRGQPTSFAIVQHQSVDHRAMVDRMKQARAQALTPPA